MTEEIDAEPSLAIRRDVHRHKRDQSTMGWIATSRGVSVPPTWRVAKFSRRNVEDGRPLDVGPGTRDDHLHQRDMRRGSRRWNRQHRHNERRITMREIERVLRAVLADVREQRVALEAAVEKIYAAPPADEWRVA
jgi:hypothetical protein